MECDSKETPDSKPELKQRRWTERFEQPVKYERFTLGRDLCFRFELPPDQTELNPEVHAVIVSKKKTHDGKPTGLRFKRESPQVLTWTLPNTPQARGIADSIDHAIMRLASRAEDQTPGR